MSLNNELYGAHHIPANKWTPQVEVSQNNVGMVPPEELLVDPYLPSLGTDPFNPAYVIAIPRGRFVAIGHVGGKGASTYRFLRTDTGKTPLTLSDGANVTPVGLSINNIYKEAQDFMTDDNNVKFRRGFVAEVPFVTAVNDAQGTLRAGDYVTGYWGSTTSTNPAYVHRGKPVRWTPKTHYLETLAAPGSSTLQLAAAVYPGITPVFITAFSSADVISNAVVATFTWVTSAWEVSFTGTGSADVSSVLYEYGQDEDQIAGETLRIQSLTDILSRDDFLKWVEMAPMDQLNFPPAATRYDTTNVGSGTDPDVDWEIPSTVVADNQYRVVNYPMSLWEPHLIAVKAKVIAKDGTLTDYSSATGSNTWFTLPNIGVIKDARGWFIGEHHSTNWKTGIISMGDSVTAVDGIRVLYSYITDPRDGAVLWGEGVLGLTDSSNLTVGRGVPAHLNLSDVVAAMRIIVH